MLGGMEEEGERRMLYRKLSQGFEKWQAEAAQARGALTLKLGDDSAANNVSVDTAQRMARAAHRRGLSILAAEADLQAASPAVEALTALGRVRETVIGVGCTAAVVSDRPKRGEHRAQVCAHSSTGVTSLYTLRLQKGRRNRVEEDACVSAVVLAAIAETCGLDKTLLLPLFGPLGIRLEPWPEEADARPSSSTGGSSLLDDVVYGPQALNLAPPGDHVDTVLAGNTSTLTFLGQPERGFADLPIRDAVIFPGSFNPLHRGERVACFARRCLSARRAVSDDGILIASTVLSGLPKLFSRRDEMTKQRDREIHPGCTYYNCGAPS